MTLHWWMHWFWITAQIVVSLTSSSPSTTSSPIASGSDFPTTTSLSDSASDTLARLQQNYRIAKDVKPSPDTPSGASVGPVPSTNLSQAGPRSLFLHTATTPAYGADNSSSGNSSKASPSPAEGHNKSLLEPSENKTLPQPPGRVPGKKESKISWVQGLGKAAKMKFENKTTPSVAAAEDMTVMPLQEEKKPGPNKNRDKNAIHREQQRLDAARTPANKSGSSADDPVLLAEETIEPRAVVTASSSIDGGLGDSTRLGRARGAFNSEFQREQLTQPEEHESKNLKNEETTKESSETGASVTEIATITGSCLAVIVLLSTLGSVGFIMYRRRYLNPPQTLNSDKCSNPDSSGYIDDSTIRDNSEEMYSLDNDSFLNSLEAMTIQNYWTDSVKHTKL